MTDTEKEPTVAGGEEKPANDSNLDRKTIFVRAIPHEATSEQLSEYFSQFAPVKHAVIVMDQEQKSRGFGFVSFSMEDDTLTALVEAKKVKFQNRLLRVDIAKRRDRKNKEQASEEKPEKKIKEKEPVEKRKSRLIIRNLPWSCNNPDRLKKLFQKYGAVHDAYIPAKKGGLMRGFAFVVMKKKAAAEKAVKESVGLKIDGREVAVDMALEKSKWEKVQEEEEKSTGRERVKEEEDDGNQEEPEIKEEEDDAVKEESRDSSDESDSEDDFDELNDQSDKELDESDEEEEEEAPKNRQEAFSVFVRNIPYDADQDSLKEHFEQFGPVKYALPVMDKVTGLAKGSAFVAFKDIDAYNKCLSDAPSVSSTSMLISDDVLPEYVYQGRILSIAATVDRGSASKLAERNSTKRKEAFGIDVGDKDKRNLFLLNEGRITSSSKLAETVSTLDMEIRDKSYKLRVQQLNKNPSLHLSMTRLAIRNLPRAMTAKSLKALGRKAVVQYATEVKEGKRHPLSKEEVNRSIKARQDVQEYMKMLDEDRKKKDKKAGVVKQAKVVMEVKGTGEQGRSRGYGFIEFRDHKTALMGLRWLNAHLVTPAEIKEGLTEEQQKAVDSEKASKRRLIVEFAIENAQVVKRRRDKVLMARSGKRKRDEKESKEEEAEEEGSAKKKQKKQKKGKGNMNKGGAKEMTDEVKQMIGKKRRMKKGKK